ncbi:MAG: hypothetical protein ABSC93_11510 [Bryobacteraceae bacterium]
MIQKPAVVSDRGWAMTNKPRNRVVVFRLSQDEYHSLLEACNRAGARNLSDFTRSEVLECLNSDAPGSHMARRFADLERQIAAIQFQLENLIQGVFHGEPQPRP